MSEGGGARKTKRDEEETSGPKRARGEGDKLPLLDPSTEIHMRPKNFCPVVGQDASVDDPYVVASYVYATSTRPDLCQPNAILKPANGNYHDLQLIVKAAYDQGFPVACRSSGHQFGGYCSGKGRTVQVDMAEWKSMRWTDDDRLVVGPGVRLGDMDELMIAKNMFLPHGECSWVCVGGHVQTGGFSVDLPRSFGFFIDHIDQFTIVMPPKDSKPESMPPIVTVHQPKEGKTSPENDELWFAIVGGSPGNFGIITQVVVKPLSDEPYLDARTRVSAFPFYDEGYQIIIDYILKYQRDPNLAADFNLSVCVVQGEMKESSGTNNIDLAMSKKHAEIYGRRFARLPCPIMLVMATWANLEGTARPYSEALDAQAFFADFAKMESNVKANMGFKNMLLTLGLSMVPMDQLHQSEEKPLRLSQLNVKFGFPARVQSNPYLSVSNCMPIDLPPTFTEWYSRLTADAATTKGAYVDNGLVYYGGNHSRCSSKFAPAKTALAHRNRGMLNLYYVHYDNVIHHQDVDLPRQMVMRNINEMARGADEFSGGDKRWNMFPNQATVGGDNEHGDVSLDRRRRFYYTDRLTYLRVLRVKRRVDPNDVFTPNEFAVGASKKYSTAKEGEPANMSLEELDAAIAAAASSPEWPSE